MNESLFNSGGKKYLICFQSAVINGNMRTGAHSMTDWSRIDIVTFIVSLTNTTPQCFVRIDRAFSRAGEMNGYEKMDHTKTNLKLSSSLKLLYCILGHLIRQYDCKSTTG